MCWLLSRGREFESRRLVLYGKLIEKLVCNAMCMPGQELIVTNRAVVVERSRASKSDNLVMLKVEGSNPGGSILYLSRSSSR